MNLSLLRICIGRWKILLYPQAPTHKKHIYIHHIHIYINSFFSLVPPKNSTTIAPPKPTHIQHKLSKQMPTHHHHHSHAVFRMIKPNPKLITLVLKALIMSLLTSLCFLFLCLAAVLILHLCLTGVSLRRRSHHHRRRHPSSVSAVFSPDDLRKLPRFRFGTKPISAFECVVCLDAIREGDSCRVLPGCNHVFHANCIDKWLVKVAACPICRARVRFDDGAIGSLTGAEECKQFWGS